MPSPAVIAVLRTPAVVRDFLPGLCTVSERQLSVHDARVQCKKQQAKPMSRRCSVIRHCDTACAAQAEVVAVSSDPPKVGWRSSPDRVSVRGLNRSVISLPTCRHLPQFDAILGCSMRRDRAPAGNSAMFHLQYVGAAATQRLVDDASCVNFS